MNWWQVGFVVLSVAYLALFWLLWKVVERGSDPEIAPHVEESLRRFIALMEAEQARFRGSPEAAPLLPENMDAGDDLLKLWLDPRANAYIHGYMKMEPAGGDKDAWERVFAGQRGRRD